MIERYLKLRVYVNEVINKSASHRNTTGKYLLNIEEVQIAEDMLVVLKPFKTITNMLSHS